MMKFFKKKSRYVYDNNNVQFNNEVVKLKQEIEFLEKQVKISFLSQLKLSFVSCSFFSLNSIKLDREKENYKKEKIERIYTRIRLLEERLDYLDNYHVDLTKKS